MRAAGEMSGTERWGFQVGGRGAWSLFHPVSREIKSAACHTSAWKLIPKGFHTFQIQDNLWVRNNSVKAGS